MLRHTPLLPTISALSLVLLASCAAPGRSSYLSSAAPAPIGPYSQAVRVGDTLYLAGQIGLAAQTGALEPGIEAQTRTTLENLAAVLAVAGLDLSHVVSTTVYLTDLNDFAAMNTVYAEFFRELPPARATVGVAALPRGARVEISCIAVR
jgi:2-iminobutanoate/2-iminopropanoate deaminase